MIEQAWRQAEVCRGLQAFVNLHSGEYAVYVPWDSKKSLAPNLPADITDVLERIDSYCQCMHGAAGVVAG